MPAMRIKVLARCIALDATVPFFKCQLSIGMGIGMVFNVMGSHGAQCDGKSGIERERASEPGVGMRSQTGGQGQIWE